MEDVDGKIQLLMKKLEAILRRHGMTPFSSKIAIHFLQANLARRGGLNRLARVINYLLQYVNGRKAPQDCSWRVGCPSIVHGLRANPFWDAGEFPWIDCLEAATPAIRKEFNELRSEPLAFQPYRSPLSSSLSTAQSDNLGQLATDSGSWNVSYLYLHGLKFDEILSKCPLTAAAISSIPRHYHHAFFSAMAPGTHITAHNGPTNKKLRIQLPLHVPRHSDNEAGPTLHSSSAPCWLRVADQRVELQEGKAIVFDDSYEHEAANEHLNEPRVVLVIDFWHPDFTDEEVKFFSFINNAQIAAAKRLARASEEEKEEVETQSPEQVRTQIPASDRAVSSASRHTESDATIGDYTDHDGGNDVASEKADTAPSFDNFLSVIQRVRAAALPVNPADIWGNTKVVDD